MGGRGGAGGFGGWTSVSSVMSQQGQTIDLSGSPLRYSGKDPAVKNRASLEQWEDKRVKSKIEYATYMDSNGNIFYEKRGGKGSVTSSYSDLARTEIFSHIHPRSEAGEERTIGGSFSTADIRTFVIFSNMQTMRAKATEGTYSITKQAGFDAKGFNRYSNQIHSDRAKVMNQVAKESQQAYKEGKITSKEYISRLENASNAYLVGMHNDYIKGQKQFGYKYYLERN